MRYPTSLFCLILSALFLCITLAGCQTPPDTPSVSDTEIQTEGSTNPETEITESVTTPQTDTEPLDTEGVTTEAIVDDILQPFPYTQRVTRTDLMIFDDAGYDYGYVNLLRPGVYTIVEEKSDFSGNIWGKLKSGLGWIDITKARVKDRAPLPISVGIADYTLLTSGKYLSFVADEGAKRVKLVFYANEALTNVSFSSLDIADDTLSTPEKLYELSALGTDMPLLIEASFPGDLTTYRISFCDADGAERHFDVYMSGRNGALSIIEYS